MDIRDAIGVSFSWSQFVKEMEKRGYTWKLNRKYPSLKTPGMERYIRLRSLGKGYGEAEIREKILRPKIQQVYGNTQMQFPRGNLRTSETVLFLFVSDGGISEEAQADSLCSAFRYPEAGPKDLPDGVFAKRRDYHQGRAGSIPETLGRTGTFFDERAQRIIPERTGRYAHSGNQWGIKRTSKKIRLSQQIEKQSWKWKSG